MNRGEILKSIEKQNFKTERIPLFAPGDTLKLHLKIKEGDKERIQLFEGVVIARRGTGINEIITLRRIASGVGVERTFVLHSPIITKITVIKRGEVRRAKLFYLRGKTGKHGKIKQIRRDKLLAIQESEIKAIEAEQAASAQEAAVIAAREEAEAKAKAAAEAAKAAAGNEVTA
jgi:large subunit ribosomal protein L19